jgi:hypothetical protein
VTGTLGILLEVQRKNTREPCIIFLLRYNQMSLIAED